MKLVSINTVESANNMMAIVPEIMLAKYNAAMMAATKILIMRSAEPIFFFIAVDFCTNLRGAMAAFSN
jgi:hypothetical protein